MNLTALQSSVYIDWRAAIRRGNRYDAAKFANQLEQMIGPRSSSEFVLDPSYIDSIIENSLDKIEAYIIYNLTTTLPRQKLFLKMKWGFIDFKKEPE